MSEVGRRAAMSDPGMRYLAQQLYDVLRRLDATERSARLQQSTIGIALTEDDDGPMVDLDVSGALFTGVEASADATTALQKAALAVRTFTQPNAPTPAQQDDGTIPEGSLWTDTDNGNRQYRWNGDPVSGVWVEQRVGVGALTGALGSLVDPRFQTIAERDAAFPNPTEGLGAYVYETGLTYQFSAGQWVPVLTFIRKGVDQSASSTTYVADQQLNATLVPGWYRIEALLHVRGNPDADITIRWSYSGIVQTGDSRHCLGPATSADTGFSTLMRSTGNAYTSEIRYGLADVSSDLGIREDLLFYVTTAGVLQLWFAEYNSASGSVVMGEQSRMFITKVR